jgi:hypothetical protein
MDEVSDPSMSVLAEGKSNGGPKPYILNKIVNTCTGQKKIIYLKMRCICMIMHNLYIRTFHIRIRAASRIGPHNKDIIEIIVGSLLGDSYGNRGSVKGTRICYRQNIIHKDYLF